MSLARRALTFSLALLVSACTTYGVVANKPLSGTEDKTSYSIGEFARKLDRRSGGLTLAAAPAPRHCPMA